MAELGLCEGWVWKFKVTRSWLLVRRLEVGRRGTPEEDSLHTAYNEIYPTAHPGSWDPLGGGGELAQLFT